MISVGANESHRIQFSDQFEVINLKRPSSNFEIVNNRFGSADTIHRCFSIARSSGCVACVVESLRDIGLLADDTSEIEALRGKCQPENWRISFWDRKPSLLCWLLPRAAKHLYGYMIVRRDGVLNEMSKWYVFESVFRKYNHRHNCVSMPGVYSVAVGKRIFALPGVMYCQQNKINKRCAQVALRSLLSRCVIEKDVSYKKINDIVRKQAERDGCSYNPQDGMNASQVRCVLSSFGISYRDMDYERAAEQAVELKIAEIPDWEQKPRDVQECTRAAMIKNEAKKLREDIPYSKFLYDGVESGVGSLLGFKVHDKDDSRHIIPIFGHTFNKDSWVSGSRKYYFGDESKSASYIQSDNWTSSFIGHDDNLGSDFCIPRAYVLPDNVAYAVELLRKGVTFPGAEAEALAVKVLSHLEERFDVKNVWVSRFVDALDDGNLILRSVSMPTNLYFNYLSKVKDWNYNRESRLTIRAFRKTKLPEVVWVVEVSLTQLFPANERKIGEVVIDATSAEWISAFMNGNIPLKVLRSILWVRLPGSYYRPIKVAGEGSAARLHFSEGRSRLCSHVPVIELADIG